MNDQATSDGLRLRRMSAEDLPEAHQLSLALKWPHRLEDWQFIEQLGAGFVLEAQRAGTSRLAGTALCWRYGERHASLGMVIVSQALQGRGLGKRLMSQVLDEIGTRSTLLHATPAGQPLYEKLGFVAIGRVQQYQGTVFQSPLIALPPGERLRPIGANDRARLISLDAQATGVERPAVLQALFEQADGVAIDRGGELTGYALMRRFGHGYAIGPVVAPDAEYAKALISHWIGTYAGIFVRIDVRAEHGLSAWLGDLGLTHVDTVVAMVRGELPEPQSGMNVFALINQALG